MNVQDIEFFWEGRKVKVSELPDLHWRYMEAVSLSNQLRFGGLVDTACTVARHCLNVSYIVERECNDSRLTRSALHHEIEEAFGVGDICHDVKHFLFNKDKSQYKAYKAYLVDTLGLGNVDHPAIKEADIAVGIIEARAFGCTATYAYCNTVDRKYVDVLVRRYGHLNVSNPEGMNTSIRDNDRNEFTNKAIFLDYLTDRRAGYAAK